MSNVGVIRGAAERPPGAYPWRASLEAVMVNMTSATASRPGSTNSSRENLATTEGVRAQRRPATMNHH